MPRAAAKAISPKRANLPCAVLGSDDFAVRARATSWAAELAPAEAGEFGKDIIDGAADNAEQAVSRIRLTLEAIQTLPFFGGRKLVWLKSANFLADTPAGRSESVQAALEDLRKMLSLDLPSGISFLLSAIDVDKRRSFYKALSKIAKIEVFDRVDLSRSGWEEEATGLVQGFARERNLRFDPEALEIFVRLAGADSRQLGNEIEKIDLYLGSERRVTEAVVRSLVSRSTTGVVWELGNAISRRDLPGALRLMDQLLFQGETPIGILYAAIIPTIRNLLAAKTLLVENRMRAPAMAHALAGQIAKLPPSATAYLPRKKDGTVNYYGLGMAATEVHRFTQQKLLRGLNACLQANVRLVTTQADPKLVFTELLTTIAGDDEL